MITKELAREMIQRKQYLADMYEKESVLMDEIIDVALLQPMTTDRWRAYEGLKRMASSLLLPSPEHYEAMMDFLAFLLPKEMNGVDDPIGMPVVEKRPHALRIDLNVVWAPFKH